MDVKKRLASVLPLALALSACGSSDIPAHLEIAGGDAERGQEAMSRYGCGTCHQIPGIPGARGLVGPPLEDFGQRSLIAGQLPNRPAVLINWILNPPALVPDTGMPTVGVAPDDARDMAADLYTLRPQGAIVWPPEVPPDRPRYDDPERPD